MSTSKGTSRFIPTLTEVVQAAHDAPVEGPHDLVDQVMQAMLPQIEAQLRASLQSSVESQVREAMAQLQVPIERAIREALTRNPPSVRL